MEFPVLDLHCDTADKLIEGNMLKQNTVHIDLDRAGGLPGYAQCFACFTSPLEPGNPIDQFEKKLAAVLREVARNDRLISQAFSADEIEDNRRRGVMSAILTIEGPAGFGYDPELLEDLYKVGFRVSTLGHNEQNPLTGSCKTGGGLTELGCEYVKEAQRLGMLVDVSHISDEGFWDIVDITDGPIIASHSNSRSVCNVSRNLTDDMFRQICQAGGVAGINLYSAFIGDQSSLDHVCDHIVHFMELDPKGKHIALGGDLDGCERLADGFSGVQDYPLLASKLLKRGLSQENVYNIFWNNALEVFKRCCI